MSSLLWAAVPWPRTSGEKSILIAQADSTGTKADETLPVLPQDSVRTESAGLTSLAAGATWPQELPSQRRIKVDPSHLSGPSPAWTIRRPRASLARAPDALRECRTGESGNPQTERPVAAGK